MVFLPQLIKPDYLRQRVEDLLTSNLVSLITHSCFAHCPSHFFLHRKAQMRASFISSMVASGDGHWWVADFPLLLSSSS